MKEPNPKQLLERIQILEGQMTQIHSVLLLGDSPVEEKLARLSQVVFNDLTAETTRKIHADTRNAMAVDHVKFEEIEVKSSDGLVMVTLSWHGEGEVEEYDHDDPNDRPLLRYDIYRLYREGDSVPDGFVDGDEWMDEEWMPVIDGSWCTQLSAKDDRELLVEATKQLLTLVEFGVFIYHHRPSYWDSLQSIHISPAGKVCI